MLYDTRTGKAWAPLSELRAEDNPRGRFEVFDSSLSEAGVLGFEYGYSVVAAGALVMWEAQFGDFNNVAQSIIDQYVTASEDKWKQTSRLTMLLPHGYEGQGPEHSSARLERFLQLCAANNLCVCYPSTPAQYFHLLRRQVQAGFERPLIVMTPKSLLRLPAAGSSLEELTSGGFAALIDEKLAIPTTSSELSSGGKVSTIWRILGGKPKNGASHYPVEQFIHSPRQPDQPSALSDAMTWFCQEEPKNMGG